MSNLTLNDSRNIVYTHFADVWQNLMSVTDENGNPVRLPFLFENEAAAADGSDPGDGDLPYARAAVGDMESGYQFLSSTQVRYDVMFYVMVYTPVDEGSAVGDDILSGLARAFRGQINTTGVWFTDQTYPKRVGVDGRWDVRMLTAPYYFYTDQE